MTDPFQAQETPRARTPVGVWVVAGLVAAILAVIVVINVEDSNRRSDCYVNAGERALRQSQDGQVADSADC